MNYHRIYFIKLNFIQYNLTINSFCEYNFIKYCLRKTTDNVLNTKMQIKTDKTSKRNSILFIKNYIRELNITELLFIFNSCNFKKLIAYINT